MAVLFGTAHWLSHSFYYSSIWSAPAPYMVLLYLCSVMAILSFSGHDLYGSWRGRPTMLMFGRLLAIWTMVFGTGLAITWVIYSIADFSLIWLAEWYVSAAAGLIGYRAVIYHMLRVLRRRYRINLKRIALIGYGATGHELHRSVDEKDWAGYEVKAVYSEHWSEVEKADPDIVRIPSLDAIPACINAYRIDEVWVTIPLSTSESCKYLHAILNTTMASVRLIPETDNLGLAGNRAEVFMGFAAIDINSLGGSDLQFAGKAILDRGLAALALIMLLPLLVIVAAIIKMSSPGPVLFKQARHGINGKRFHIYKFRTMRIHACQGQLIQATRNDQRVTRFGAFLRRTSIDELPQFINVLRGEMSIVGPRPHAVEHNEHYSEVVNLYMQRHRVKPGITGWAQIHGLRGETDTLDKMVNRVRLDLEYIQNWSLWLDLRIIAWTALKGWSGKNAF
jgi:putative colanic acid biosynthesis UDP-glucose lipid carrier transferase